MEKQSFFVEVKEMVEEYVEDRLLLIRLQLTEKAAKLSAVVFLLVCIGMLSLILLMIISFIAGYCLSQAVGSYPIGFGILAIVYVVLILLLIVIHRKYTGKIISNRVVKFSMEDNEV